MKRVEGALNRALGLLNLRLSRASAIPALLTDLDRRQAELNAALQREQAQHEEAQREQAEREKAQREQASLLARSQTRWRADEPDAGLTWGVPMEGDSFVEYLLKHVRLDNNCTIVEVGPGYGRILQAVMKRGVPFGRYIGLEISEARVSRLRETFHDPRIEFRQADLLGDLDLNAAADLTFSSAVFEHLYPDFGRALQNISRFTRPGGSVVIDFIRSDEKLEEAAAWFDQETYMRRYSLVELTTIFEQNGFLLNDTARISFGQDILNREIARTITLGTKGNSSPMPEARRFRTFVDRDVPVIDHMTVNPPVIPVFRSPFGGLWTDLNNAEAVVSGKVETGMLSPAEASLVEAWMRNGFVILPGAVDAAAIDAAMDDLERAYDGALRRKMSYWDDTGHHYEAARRENMRKPDAKLLDLHDVSEAAQAIQFASPLGRFLEILFERPALAFQSLGFYYGSRQPVHQDTAFVRVSSPMEFVASWIALEDIVPGSGELEYYPGSHALPLHLFKGQSPWVQPGDKEVEAFSDLLHSKAKQAGLSIQRFLPRKGDVLIWSAALMHGGSPVDNPGQTRKSLVTHYCPADQQPMYAYKGGRPKRPSVRGHYVMSESWD